MSAKRIALLLVPLAGGAIYGLAWARFLFEVSPQRFMVFNTWAGAIACGALGGMGALYLFANRLRALPACAALYLPLPLLGLLAPDVNLLRSGVLLAGSPVVLIALWGEKKEREGEDRDNDRVDFVASSLLFFFLFSLFLFTLGRYVGESDPFEFQVTAARLGIAHGAGYPLLMLLARLFTLLPVGGTLAFRANLTTAFFGALAAVGAQQLTRRLGAARLTAFLAGLVFGVSPTLWARATELEAYTLNAFFLAALLHLALTLLNYRPTPSDLRLPTSHLYSAAFLFGLGLTDHLTTLLAAPALGLATIIALVRWHRAARRTLDPSLIRPVAHLAKVIGTALACALVGYSVYLYLPLRWPAVNHGELLQWDQFLYLLRGGSATGEFDLRLILTDAVRWGSLFSKIVAQYTWPGFALAVLGVIALAVQRRTRWRLAILLVTYAAEVAFVMAYNTRDPDWSDFFIPLHLLAAVFMGIGLQTILNPQYTIRNRTMRDWALGTVYSAFCLLPLSSIWHTLPQVDRSHNSAGYLAGRYTLNYPLARGAAILADPAHFAPLYYLQAAEGVRPDLDIAVLPDEASYRSQLDERVAAGQVVYLARYLPGLGSFYSLRSVGPLAQVSGAPFTATARPAYPLAATLASGIQLLGFEADTLDVAPPEPLHLTLYWHLTAPADDNYLVHLRLLDSENRVVRESAGSVPVNRLYPTNAWEPGETVTDFYEVPTDASLAPGVYRLEVGMFPPFRVSDRGWAPVTAISVRAPTESPQPEHSLRARFGANWLLGYNAPESAAPGSQIGVTLFWLRSAGSDSVIAFGETRSLAAWPVGTVIPLKYRLPAPGAAGEFPLTVAGDPSAQCGWLAPVTSSCLLTTIHLVGEAVAPGAVNFDNQLVLRRASFDPATVERGATVNVDLEWQALQTIHEDYTVFVHLVGPDGQLYGQIDYYPVRGTLPTSHWQPGQIVHDPYALLVPADAPPGDYTLRIGMYLLATLERLPVLNAAGEPVDDNYALVGLTVR